MNDRQRESDERVRVLHCAGWRLHQLPIQRKCNWGNGLSVTLYYRLMR